MSKAFGKNNGRPNRVKRNSLNLSFQNNGSYQYGYLYPVLCKEVLPGDSVDMSITAGLKAMPFVFPVQTRQRVIFHAFYCRNRNLWSGWQDFITKTKPNLVSPYIAGDNNLSNIVTGSIYDYMGVPTTIVGDSISHSNGMNLNPFATITASNDIPLKDFPWPLDQFLNDSSVNVQVSNQTRFNFCSSEMSAENFDLLNTGTPFVFSTSLNALVTSSPQISYIFENYTNAKAFLYFYSNADKIVRMIIPATVESMDSSTALSLCFNGNAYQDTIKSELHTSPVSDWRARFMVQFEVAGAGVPTGLLSASALLSSPSPASINIGIHVPNSTPVDFNSTASYVNPFSTESGRISSLPMRAYESIYNAFYRDDRNNPLIVNGVAEYNKYLTNTDGGADEFEYKLHRRNWEQDAFTTALPSPQQGTAPLVGISSTGVMTFSDPDTGKTYNVQAVTSDDGDTLIGATYQENIPNSVARSLVNYATSGISINDFRNVNAFQRWLETNIRRGLKYRDQIKSHYDVDVSFAELDMPEFIGGTSIDVDMNMINQTSESTSEGSSWSSALGSYAGQGFAVGRSKNRIKKYFDEHGFLMVIMCIVPNPNYSQTIDPFFYKRDALDYFFPEFGHVGLQAIPNKVIAPIQSSQVSESAMNSTFGYQRPWYEYLEYRDEVHGLLRTQLRNFVLNRVFEGIPTLNESFLLIDPNQMNEVFAVTDITDKWIGEIYFDIKMKRPIPLYGVPRLESNI